MGFLAYRLNVYLMSGERDSLTIGNWADPAVRELAGHLEASRHVRQVQVVQIPDTRPLAAAPSAWRSGNQAVALGLGIPLLVIGLLVSLVGLIVGFTPIHHSRDFDCGSGWVPDDYFQCPAAQAEARQTSLMFLLPGLGMVVAGTMVAGAPLVRGRR